MALCPGILMHNFPEAVNCRAYQSICAKGAADIQGESMTKLDKASVCLVALQACRAAEACFARSRRYFYTNLGTPIQGGNS